MVSFDYPDSLNERLAFQKNAVTEKVSARLEISVLAFLTGLVEKLIEKYKEGFGLTPQTEVQELTQQLDAVLRSNTLLLTKFGWEITGAQYGWDENLRQETEEQGGEEALTLFLLGLLGQRENPAYNYSGLPTRSQEFSKISAETYVGTMTTQLNTIERGLMAQPSLMVDGQEVTPTRQSVAPFVLAGGLSYTKNYANVVSRSITSWSTNAGSQRRFEHEGITLYQWYATLDERTCPYCRLMHGTIVDKGQSFVRASQPISGDGVDRKLNAPPWNVNHPPLHPKCRCIIVPKLGSF